MIQPVHDLRLLIFGVQGTRHAQSDIRDGLDVTRNERVVLGVSDQVRLGLYFMKDPWLDCEILITTLHALTLISRPRLPWTIDWIIMFRVLFTGLLSIRTASLGEVKVDLPIVASDR